MNEYTARVLRNALNRERFYLEQGTREARERGTELAQIVGRNTEAEQRIAALTETLEAAGASTEPWPDALTQPIKADA